MHSSPRVRPPALRSTASASVEAEEPERQTLSYGARKHKVPTTRPKRAECLRAGNVVLRGAISAPHCPRPPTGQGLRRAPVARQEWPG